MANEIFKEIKTRIALRTGDYAYWTTGAGANIELRKGEVCVCTVTAANKQATTAPTVLFKVSDANGKKFADLDWVSAKAADVYEWAKKTEAEFSAWVKTLVTVDDIDLSNYFTKEEVNGLLATNSSNDQAYADSVAATAKSEAISAAATDATNKANNAEQNAKSHADSLNTAMNTRVKSLEDHKDDYKAYADQAEADAITTAANDATGKANKALEDAKAHTNEAVTSLKNNEIAGNTIAINNEVARAKAEEERLAGLISDNTSAITTEKGRAEGIEAGLRTDVDAVTARVEAFLDNTGAATEAIDTLQELLTYINKHDDVEISTIIADIEVLEGKLAGINSTVVDYVTAAINALKIGDYAKATDLTALAIRVKAIEDAPYATTANVATAKQEAISAAKTYTDQEVLKEKNRAEGIEGGLRTDLNNLSTNVTNNYETKIDAASKLEAAKGYADSLAGNYATSAQGAKADSALQEMEASTGLKVAAKANNKQTISIDTDVVFILDCNW